MSIRAAFPILRISGVCGEAGALSPPRGVPGIRRFPVVVRELFGDDAIAIACISMDTDTMQEDKYMENSRVLGFTSTKLKKPYGSLPPT